MHLLVVADTYVPARISAAVQLRDLVAELAKQGHHVTVVVPAFGQKKFWNIEMLDGARVLRVRAPRCKDVGLIRRAMAEMSLPFVLLRGLKLSGVVDESWGGVIWYSPTIFLGPVASYVKRRNGCRAYLIVRDLFPDWAVDAGVMRRGAVYHFFKIIERFQYRVADIIGVQTPSNGPLVARDAPQGARIDVLHNWLANQSANLDDNVEIDLGQLAGRTIFVYSGNMGVAQDLDAFIELAASLLHRLDIGFLFVGRGSEFLRLSRLVAERSLENVRFMEEVDSARMPLLLSKCHVGIVALDPRHTTHNIPGKFISYMRNGLPVLARVNLGNDLVQVIRRSGVGYAVEGDSLENLKTAAEEMATYPDIRGAMAIAGLKLAERSFTPGAAAKQLVDGLRG